jgi:hypothetical protein
MFRLRNLSFQNTHISKVDYRKYNHFNKIIERKQDKLLKTGIGR